VKNLKKYENFEQFSFLGESMNSKLQGEMVNAFDLASKAAKESKKADPKMVAAIYECIKDKKAYPHLSMLASGDSGSYVVGTLAMLLNYGAPLNTMVSAAERIATFFLLIKRSIVGGGTEINSPVDLDAPPIKPGFFDFEISVTEEIKKLQKCLKSK